MILLPYGTNDKYEGEAWDIPPYEPTCFGFDCGVKGRGAPKSGFPAGIQGFLLGGR